MGLLQAEVLFSINYTLLGSSLVLATIVAMLIDWGLFFLALREAPNQASNSNASTFRLPSVFYAGTPGFFRNPYRFLNQWTKLGNQKWFWFKVRNDRVLALSGDEARRVLVTNRNLSAVLGYSILNPSLRRMIAGKPDDDPITFNWFFKKVLRTETIASFVGSILVDVNTELSSWEGEGIMDPFIKLRRVVLVAVLRFLMGDEILQNPTKLNQLLKSLEVASTLDTPIFLWIPTPARIRRLFAGIKLFNIMLEAVRARRKHGRPMISRPDVLQTILDDEHNVDDKTAARLMISALFAAGGSSSIVYPWMHIWLALHPEFKEKAHNDIDMFVEKHSSGRFAGVANNLIDVPLSVWEANLQLFDFSLRESLRLGMVNVVPRHNVGDDVKIGHETLRHGDFALYMLEDVHYDPAIYPEPHQFNPLRSYNHSREYTFLGWGAGPHACIGQRLAKIMVKLTSALVLAEYTFEVVDKDGNLLKEFPRPQGTLFGITQPPNPVFLKFKRRNLEKKKKRMSI